MEWAERQPELGGAPFNKRTRVRGPSGKGRGGWWPMGVRACVCVCVCVCVCARACLPTRAFQEKRAWQLLRKAQSAVTNLEGTLTFSIKKGWSILRVTNQKALEQ